MNKVKKIIAFIKNCKEKQYDDATIIDMLENGYILEDLLKDTV